MSLHCIAIDDEPIALKIIEQFCRRLGGLHVETYSDISEGLERIKTTNPDVVFLDIEMGEVSGLQVASGLAKEVCVIFTTAFLQYAVDGFNLDAVDYLHKPFSFERFKEAVRRAKRRIGYAENDVAEQTVVIRRDYNNVPLKTSEILYIEAMENYSKIFLTSGSMILARNSLKNLSEILPDNQFIRIHKSYIVPKAGIKSYTRHNVLLHNGVKVPVGRQYIDILKSNFET